ncbi:Putative S-adenosyl-L-methionine-dependent methyltransferase MidA [Nannochloropsis gaditana]|uniref:Protein arginine methyltransferase NDUFAF7 n=1 Tax=Nannochloropsis gaditana TaxID=72520 RepID=W7U1W5_9STRA|nr:Putative S-adenosyl-L-methionine-dependent methyltransferase MidA [Nannochloropsis gaditana]
MSHILHHRVRIRAWSSSLGTFLTTPTGRCGSWEARNVRTTYHDERYGLGGSGRRTLTNSTDVSGEHYISVDKRGLYEEVTRAMSGKKEKSPLTPLGKLLQTSIKQVGPISIADFMDVCLAHPEHGYYMKQQTTKIGKGGDFVTAPEISQMFGELLGVWAVATWEKLGTPRVFRLAEIGPGKGTLMKDILRVAQNFPPFHNALGGVSMIETSQALRRVQAEALGAVSIDKNWTNSDTERDSDARDIGDEAEWERGGRRHERKARWCLPCKRKIDWHDDVRQMPVESPSIIFAQELLDALPVHQFEYTENGWRERLVDVDEDPQTPHHFKFILAKEPTVPVIHLERIMPRTLQNFLDTAACSPCGHDKISDGTKTDEAIEDPEKKKLGTSLEVCPLALQLAQHVAERVSRTGGAALFVDYGEDMAQGDTLRGLKMHALVHPLAEPGEVDLSADVDFQGLREAVAHVEGLRVFGPMSQGEFLSAMGIEARLQALLGGEGEERSGLTDRQALLLYDSYRRLVDPEQMGRKYKVLAFVAKSHQGPAVAFPSTSLRTKGVTENSEEASGE